MLWDFGIWINSFYELFEQCDNWFSFYLYKLNVKFNFTKKSNFDVLRSQHLGWLNQSLHGTDRQLSGACTELQSVHDKSGLMLGSRASSRTFDYKSVCEWEWVRAFLYLILCFNPHPCTCISIKGLNNKTLFLFVLFSLFW